MDGIERRRAQNRNAQRRFRSKKASIDAAKKSSSSYIPVDSSNIEDAATVNGTATQPREEPTGWIGLTTSDETRVRSDTLEAVGDSLLNGASYLGPDMSLADSLSSQSFLDLLAQTPTNGDFHSPPPSHILYNPTAAVAAAQSPPESPKRRTGSDGDTQGRPKADDGKTSQSLMRSMRTSRTLETIMADFGASEYLPDPREPFQTSLHIAAERGHEDIVNMLLALGIAVDERDSEHNTALHRATRNKQLSVALTLLKDGANPNAVNILGWTPVHIAVSVGSIEIVAALVRYGGDLTIKARGCT